MKESKQLGCSVGGMTLLQAPVRRDLKIVYLNPESPLHQRLQELGCCDSSIIKKISEGTGVIVEVCGVRLALGRELAGHVVVEPLPPGAPV